MKVRRISIFSGKVFDVPQGIQRIDHRATHGWQLRYAGTRLYSDHSSDGSGAAVALQKAIKELLRRIATLPAPSHLQRAPSANKRSGLPAGITGPVVRVRRSGATRDCSLMVLIPSFGGKPRRRTIYIGTENTYTLERYDAALARAIEMRTAAVQAYEEASTRAKRADARQLKKEARQASEMTAVKAAFRAVKAVKAATKAVRKT